MNGQPLAPVRSLKVKLGLLVGASVVVAAAVATLGRAGEVSPWLSIPVTILLALAVTQLLAVGMTSPLREMTAAARRMARGDYAVRVSETSSDEVGELARAFNRMAHDLAMVDRQRRDLVANVSHELRTPLTALQAVLENAVDGAEPPEPRALQPALAQAERLGDLVTDLLDLARVEAGKAPLSPEPVAVADLLADAVEEARVTGRPVEYDVRVDPPDLIVPADPARLRQLVANLLDNASRHSPAGGRVRVSVTRAGDQHRIEVADQGSGVAPVDRERAFEPFGTLTATEGGGGTGLGLAIARWVTDLHGGSIGFVDPEPGSTGARVRVDLPAEPPVRPVARQQPPEPAPPTPAPPRAPAVPPAPLSDDLFGSFWPDRGVPARRALLLGALGVGLLAAVVLPYRDAGLGTFFVLLAGGIVVMTASARGSDLFTRVCAGICVLLAANTVLRDADWVIALSVVTGAVVTVCGVTGARTLSGFVLSGLSGPLAGLRGLPWLGRTLVALTGGGSWPALLRTVVWSVVGLLVFGLLFASADALFAEWADALVPDLELESFVLRAFIGVAVGGVVLAAAYLALNPPRVDPSGGRVRPVTRLFEWLAPVLVVDAVFAAFLVAQAAVIFGGHDYLRRTTGLTYAEYVHEGFGQLTVATALTLLVIWAAARKAPRETPADRLRLRLALGVLCAQTLVVVGSALYRMHVYQEAYGFTELRLLVDVFEGWLGLLVVAVMVADLSLRGGWLPRFALLSGAGLVLALAAINPDAWIAQRNVDRYEETGKLDWEYLQGLSDDAVPVLNTLPADVRHCALIGRAQADDDWLEWNLGRWRAADLLPEGEPMAELMPIGCPERQ
jgi:two-component system, OmpR family, sensor histidine kinase BaeS